MRTGLAAIARIPNSTGTNLYRVDRDAGALFRYYLPDDLFRHLEPTFERLGALAGDRLDRLAGAADKIHPPYRSVCGPARIAIRSRSIQPIMKWKRWRSANSACRPSLTGVR